jgi:Holliday junction resolvase RusA-like endonuclease
MLIHLVAPGQPVSGKNHMRPVKLKNGRMSIRKGEAVTDWYDRVVPVLARQFAALGLTTIRGHVYVDTTQYLKHSLDSKANPDADNATAAVYDALVKARVIADDRQIVSWGGLREQDATNPRVEILVRVL